MSETDVVAVISAELPRGPGQFSPYSSEYLQAAKDYLANYAAKGDVVPTIEGLAVELKRGVKTMYNWGESHPEFKDVMEQILATQGRELQNKGLKKEIDSSITKLLLSANHAKSERSQQDITSGGEKVSGFIYMPAKKPEGAGA